MTRTRTIVLIVIGLLPVLAAIHITLNGLPSLDSLNPHSQ
jgi:hypothetical protein